MKKFSVAILGLVAVFAMTVAPTALPAKSKVVTVKVTMGKPTEFGYVFSAKAVKAGSTVKFVVTNKGTLPHDLKFGSKGTKVLQPKKSQTFTIKFAKKGKQKYRCTVAGHEAAGMKGVFTVK